MTEHPHYPNISQAIGLVILFFIFSALASIPLGILAGITEQESIATHPIAIAAVNLIAMGAVLAIGLKKTGASASEVFPFRPFRLSLLPPMVLTIVGMSILLSEMDNLLRTFIPAPAWFIEMFLNLIGGQTSPWGSFFVLVIVAPLTEELLMRGLILRGFLSHYSEQKAILVSAILFGLIHFNPWQFIGATLLGVLFAWWFVETRSLLPCLFGHALANSIPLLFGAVFHLEIEGYSSEFSHIPTFQPLWFDILGLVLVASGGWLLIRAFERAGGGKDENRGTVP
jgi:uncharacterized protein